jgi:hypothetical protein
MADQARFASEAWTPLMDGADTEKGSFGLPINTGAAGFFLDLLFCSRRTAIWKVRVIILAER